MTDGNRTADSEWKQTGIDGTAIDRVDEAGMESFPASDPPGWVAVRPGVPPPDRRAPAMNATELEIWNRALETAARLVEGADGLRQRLSADIRARKQPSH